jgi:hypothetical protein
MKRDKSAFLRYLGGTGPKTTFECSICDASLSYLEITSNAKEPVKRRIVGAEFKHHVENEHPSVKFREPAQGQSVLLQGEFTCVEYSVFSVDPQQQTADLRSVKDAPGIVRGVPWSSICYSE